MQKQKIVLKDFRPLFCHFWTNLGAVRPPKYIAQNIFVAAPFELFCRILGHLAIVCWFSNTHIYICVYDYVLLQHASNWTRSALYTILYPFTLKIPSAACNLVPQSAKTKFRLGFCIKSFFYSCASL